MVLCLLSVLSLDAHAQPAPVPEPPPPLSYSLRAGGTWIAENLSQIEANAAGILGYTAGTFHNDLLFSGYRIWTQLPGTDTYTRIGDDLSITTVPAHSFTERFSVFGIGHYSYSQLHQLDGRVLAGVAAGYSPVHTALAQTRIGLGGFYERTAYPSADFSRDVSHDGPVRTVPRLGLIVQGRYRPEDSPLTLRTIGWFYINPVEPEDLRATLDTTVGVRVGGPVSLQLSVLAAGSSVVVEGVEPYDLRSTLGVSLASPDPRSPARGR